MRIRKNAKKMNFYLFISIFFRIFAVAKLGINEHAY